jgi:hypothetical protein
VEFDSILVFAFGNRILDNGALLPGPVNEELARATNDLQGNSGVPVFAQWEIADILIADGVENVISVTPNEDADGNIVYLSTDGVARKAMRMAAEMGIDVGRAAVLGHRDHVERCRRTAIKAGIQVVTMPEEIMPSMYDPESGQEWTRSREVYLKVDAYALRLLTES